MKEFLESLDWDLLGNWAEDIFMLIIFVGTPLILVLSFIGRMFGWF